MPRTRTTPAPAPRYVTTTANDRHQVADRFHGYALSTHDDPDTARRTAELLNTTPAAACAAVRALDAAQTGPAAEVRRSLRRYGYRWALQQGDAIALHGYHQLTELTAGQHLAMVWTPAGMPYYVTPERFAQLPIRWVDDEREIIPTAPAAELTRYRERLMAMPPHKRHQLCELHGLATGWCLICGPGEAWECDWGTCRANAVTTSAGRPLCERCAPILSPGMAARAA